MMLKPLNIYSNIQGLKRQGIIYQQVAIPKNVIQTYRGCKIMKYMHTRANRVTTSAKSFYNVGANENSEFKQ